MTKEEYIIKSGANDASSLTDEQILAYYINLYGGLADLRNNDSANIIKEGRAFGLDIDRPKAMDMLRQAFEQDKKTRYNLYHWRRDRKYSRLWSTSGNNGI